MEVVSAASTRRAPSSVMHGSRMVDSAPYGNYVAELRTEWAQQGVSATEQEEELAAVEARLQQLIEQANDAVRQKIREGLEELAVYRTEFDRLTGLMHYGPADDTSFDDVENNAALSVVKKLSAAAEIVSGVREQYEAKRTRIREHYESSRRLAQEMGLPVPDELPCLRTDSASGEDMESAVMLEAKFLHERSVRIGIFNELDMEYQQGCAQAGLQPDISAGRLTDKDLDECRARNAALAELIKKRRNRIAVLMTKYENRIQKAGVTESERLEFVTRVQQEPFSENTMQFVQDAVASVEARVRARTWPNTVHCREEMARLRRELRREHPVPSPHEFPDIEVPESGSSEETLANHELYVEQLRRELHDSRPVYLAVAKFDKLCAAAREFLEIRLRPNYKQEMLRARGTFQQDQLKREKAWNDLSKVREEVISVGDAWLKDGRAPEKRAPITIDGQSLSDYAKKAYCAVAAWEHGKPDTPVKVTPAPEPAPHVSGPGAPGPGTDSGPGTATALGGNQSGDFGSGTASNQQAVDNKTGSPKPKGGGSIGGSQVLGPVSDSTAFRDLFESAKAYFDSEKFVEAVQMCTAALEKATDDNEKYDALCLRTEVFTRMGRLSEAERDIKELKTMRSAAEGPQ